MNRQESESGSFKVRASLAAGFAGALGLLAACGERAPEPPQQSADAAQAPAAAVIPTPGVFGPIGGPGPIFTPIHEGLSGNPPRGEALADFGYVLKEYFLDGTANGKPYVARVLVRRPADASRFSGIVVAEPMHLSGNSMVFYLAHQYIMSAGHIALEIAPNSATLKQIDGNRYRPLDVKDGQANEILAQVGAFIRSDSPLSPLTGFKVRRMVLAGNSESTGTAIGFTGAGHDKYRLADRSPIFDGYLLTSYGGDAVPGKVDVPVIQMPTMNEVIPRASKSGADKNGRADGDEPGDQFRLYEVAGMFRTSTRDNIWFQPNLCKYPVSRFPNGAMVAVGLDHLIQWVDKGKAPPRAPRIEIDNDTGNDGSVLALDAYGNPKGGIRTTYVDVPVRSYKDPNEGASPPAAKQSAFFTKPPDTIVAMFKTMNLEPGHYGDYVCPTAGRDAPLSRQQLRSLYKDKKDYRAKLEQKLDELTQAGWFLPVYRDTVLKDPAPAAL